MSLRFACILLSGVVLLGPVWPAEAGQPATSVRQVRVSGVVRDEANAITLPGVPVEVMAAVRSSTPTWTAATCSTSPLAATS